jgi:predicted TIM-barrel fold metal-dependent hydrolase
MQYNPFDPSPGPLSRPLPPGSCDSQAHAFGHPAYPLAGNRAYDPAPGANIDSLRHMHTALGFERGVLVQGSAHGHDHSYMLAVLRTLPDYRGVILMDEKFSDADLADMHAAGVRGARFAWLKEAGLGPGPAELKRSLARVAELGWFAKFFIMGDQWLEMSDVLRHIPVQAVIDHLGLFDPAGGTDQPVCRAILDLLERDNWWMMLSHGDRLSAQDRGWDDVVPIGRAFVHTAPDRVIWGSDWPHVRHSGRMPNDAELVELLFRYAPDEADLQRILVDNPRRLFAFSG